MPLPQLNAVPQYELIMPSTGKAHKFRPFLVKEEKVLMIAAESQEMSQMVNAIGNIVESCVEGVDKKELSAIDIEYSFLQIRSKSVGETSQVSIKCEGCEAEIPIDINISEIKPPDIKEKKKKVNLGNNIHINLTMPKYISMADIDVNPENGTEAVFTLIATCVDSVITENEHIKASDVSHQELKEFIESMTNDQFKEIQEFIQNLPRLKHEIEVTGPCGHVNKSVLEGVQSFF